MFRHLVACIQAQLVLLIAKGYLEVLLLFFEVPWQQKSTPPLHDKQQVNAYCGTP